MKHKKHTQLIGEYLLANKIIQEYQLKDILYHQKQNYDLFGLLLLKKGYITEKQLIICLEQLGIL
jgi:hypothetical protein